MGRIRFSLKLPFGLGESNFECEILFLENPTFHLNFMFFVQVSISVLISFSISKYPVNLYG